MGSRPRSLLPVVVVDAEARKPVVLEATAEAEREGVHAGLSVPQALARCPELVVRHRSRQAEASLEELLFALAYSLSPRVERDGAGEVLVDLKGAKLEEALQRCGQIVAELSAMGICVGIGVAESCVVAALAAKSFDWAQDALAGRVLLVGGENRVTSTLLQKDKSPAERPIHHVNLGEFVECLPIGDVPFGADPASRARLLDVLSKWGVRTVSAFAKLKRAAVGARLGVEGLRLWDRVTGKEQRVVAVAELPAEFEESWEFEYDVDSVDPLLFLLRRFLDTLCLRMRVAHKVAAFARVELGLAYGEPLVVEQKLPEATADEGALFSLLAARLEEVETDSPVARISLWLEVVDFKQRQLGLFESSLKNPYRFTQTLSRVAGIVGEDRVGRPVLEEDGRPDGVRMEELPAAVPPVGELDLGRMFGMPLRRYRPGLVASVEFQGRQPIWIQCETVSGFVKAVRGPWLNSGHWWEETGSWNCVEWDVELNKGGVYRICKDADGWKVEGNY
ncbi:DNA polymerase Y family protein [Pelagicoccus enzymogenes]|uniref:DNA polymerase Y family protein n=1 Tax=Pelagicoccus enzymogenes TaxID=2773457 RepID=UPI00280D3993|nr:DNA polymerase Y family protein [Pelagicoccus enzymogenes]MDQ8196658.1 DNA polymerase Y family protein [Pelagicoccus enzymogenes]